MYRREYYLTRSGDIKARYDAKIEIIDVVDPYAIRRAECQLDILQLPNIKMIDLVNYLILTHSYYTGQQLKAYKSLQAFKQYESGSVQEILAKQINQEAFVVISKVQHSQRKKEKLLQVWIILLQDTSISCAHCTCMTGLSEVRSHVATVLFCLHARPNSSDDSGLASTEQLSVWPVPPLRNVEMLRIRDMDWSKKNKVAHSSQVYTPSNEKDKLVGLLAKFQKMGVNSAICSLWEPFASEMEVNEPQNLPPSLDDLYSSDLVGKSYEELLTITQNMDTSISEEQIKIIEATTRDQSQNNTWFKYRAGRITASLFKSVCRTSIEKPSLTVIKGVCYPEKVTFYSKQTSYGIKHEKTALEAYKEHVSSQHTNLIISATGFVISKKHSELGATPDSLVTCDCCGLGCVEIKCPYLLADKSNLDEYADIRHTCLNNINGEFSLDRSHCYYYQIQCQMFVTDCKYCDFVVWCKELMYIERVMFDHNFCLENISKALDFHKYVIKPELSAKYFTEKGGIGRLVLWCICESPDDGRLMLRCDSDNCEIQWFHFECVKVSSVPLTWYCNNC